MRCEASNVWVGDHYEYCQREGKKGADGRGFCRWHRAARTRHDRLAREQEARWRADTEAAVAHETRCEGLGARLGTEVVPYSLGLRGSGVRGYSDVSAQVPLGWLEQLADAMEVGWARLRGHKSWRGRMVERGELVLPPVE